MTTKIWANKKYQTINWISTGYELSGRVDRNIGNLAKSTYLLTYTISYSRRPHCAVDVAKTIFCAYYIHFSGRTWIIDNILYTSTSTTYIIYNTSQTKEPSAKFWGPSDFLKFFPEPKARVKAMKKITSAPPELRGSFVVP